MGEMGQDFLRAKAARFKKAIDSARVELATATLFTREPECAERNALADLAPDQAAELGEKLILKFEADRLVALRVNVMVATFACPPRELLEAVARSGGMALGEVVQVNPLSRTVSIRIS
jgi:hypothetical protein